MHKPTINFTRLLAAIWLIFTIGSGLLSVYLVFKAWSLQPSITADGKELINNGVNILNSLDEGIQVINQALENINLSLQDLGDSTGLIQETVHNTAEMSGSFKVLLAEDFTVMTNNTLIAVQSTEKTAGVIDGTLYALSKVPLLGIPYDPETSLSSALGNIAAEMEDMPQMLQELSVSMESTSKNLSDLETEIGDISSSLETMQETLDHAILLVDEYQQYTKQAQENLNNLMLKIETFINTFLWVFTLIIVVILNGLVSAIIQAWNIVFINQGKTKNNT